MAAAALEELPPPPSAFLGALLATVLLAPPSPLVRTILSCSVGAGAAELRLCPPALPAP